jgi:hypothetical protein
VGKCKLIFGVCGLLAGETECGDIQQVTGATAVHQEEAGAHTHQV